MIPQPDGSPQKLEWFQMAILLLYFAGVKHVMVLMPKGNGKTSMLAALAIFHMLTTPVPKVFVGAATVDQAETFYDEAIRIVEARKAWRKRLVPRPGYRAIHMAGGKHKGLLRVLSSDKLGKGFQQGLQPTLGIIEELHAHVNNALYAAIRGGLDKRQGQMLSISTAGWDPESVLGKIRATVHKMKYRVVKDFLTFYRSDNGQFAMFEWAVPEGRVNGVEYDPFDMDTVRRANPASFVTSPGLKDTFEDPGTTTGDWLRYHCGIWAAADGTWMDPETYDACERPNEKLEDGDPVVLAYDHARRYDHAALVAIRPDEPEIVNGEVVEGSGSGFVVPIKFWNPAEEDGGKVPFWKIKEGIREACKTYRVLGVGYDKLGGFAQSAEELEDEGIPMIEVSMRSSVWAPLTAEMESAMKSQRWRHNGDKEMRKHVLASETKDTPDGERLHGRVKGKVDGNISAGIGWNAAFMTNLLTNQDSVWDRRAEADPEGALL